MNEPIEICVDKHDFQRVHVDASAAGSALSAGEIRLALDRFALTANNVTYATLGESAAFWRLFPAPAPWGRVPVWGFAEVVASRHEEIAIGERVFGLLPMASEVVLAPARVTRSHFVDAAAHREVVFPVYNQYARCGDGAWHDSERNDLHAVLRPLFFTSFVLADQLAEAAYFGSRTVLLSSASSKTALGTAFVLRARGNVRVVGLTSARHAGFVADTGCFDGVLGYDELEALTTTAPLAYVDFSGDAELRRALHTRLGASLVHSLAVGATHRPARSEGAAAPPGMAVQTFFGPAQIRKRRAEWGAEALHARHDAAERRFISAAGKWLRIERLQGAAAVVHGWRALLAGRVGPDRAFIGTLLPGAPVDAAEERAALSFLQALGGDQ